jgi:polyisoprenoid-binding protein YceI
MMLSRRLVLLAALALAPVAVAAHLPPAAGEEPQTATKPARKPALKPGEIDLEKSRVYVRVGKKGLGHEHGVEGKIKSGTIDLNASKNAGEIEFDMSSFLADTDEARKYVELKGTTAEATRDKVTETMLGEAVLDVEQFPTATFKIKSRETKKTKAAGDTVVLKGDFILHGQSQALTVEARVEKTEGRSHLRGEFTILQSDFGITPYKAALGTVGVADELKIWGDLWIADRADSKK